MLYRCRIELMRARSSVCRCCGANKPIVLQMHDARRALETATESAPQTGLNLLHCSSDGFLRAVPVGRGLKRG